ncbi:MAG: metalloregulator ArsR/SmtB family transcription factor [Eubacteriaceae bacterium]|jgi:ArsR family transcriptional regulator|nr:metalloregulator ArsR/SmtB family transcription factor [Eubacteriaceae bacterium]
MKIEEVTAICRALGDSNRLQIVQMLTQGEKCACNILDAFEITQPTMSHHMKILCECGLVKCRKEGKWCHYSIDCERFREFKDFITEVSCCDNAEMCNSEECGCK